MAAFHAFYPPSGGGGGTNPSIGTNGVTSPTSSTLVAGQNPTGLQQPLQTDAAGALITTPSATGVQHVIVDSSALPTGASTSALQTSGNASLTSIDTKTPALVSGRVPVDGSGVTQPISAATLPLPTGAATSANQVTAQASLTSIDSKLTSPLAVTGPLTDTQLRATPVPISGTVSTGGLTDTQLRATPVPVSGTVTATGPLTDTQLRANPVPVSGTVTATGPLTDTQLRATAVATNQTQINGVTVATGSGTTNTGTQRVVLATDQTSIPTSTGTPIAGTVSQAAVTVGTTAVRATVTGSAPVSTRKVLLVQPSTTSTATFYIGGSTVTTSGSTRGIPLSAGQTFTANSDAGDYYIISSVAAQTVFILEQS